MESKQLYKPVTPDHDKATCQACETYETVYAITLSVVVTLTGKPECHNLLALVESAQDRIGLAFDQGVADDVIDSFEVIEVIRDPCPACDSKGWLIVAIDGDDDQLRIERCDECRDVTGLTDEDAHEQPEAQAALAAARGTRVGGVS